MHITTCNYMYTYIIICIILKRFSETNYKLLTRVLRTYTSICIQNMVLLNLACLFFNFTILYYWSSELQIAILQFNHMWLIYLQEIARRYHYIALRWIFRRTNIGKAYRRHLVGHAQIIYILMYPGVECVFIFLSATRKKIQTS